MERNDSADERHDDRPTWRRRLNAAGWGLLLAWSGALILLPGDLNVLWHVWLLGAGAIVLGLAGLAAGLGSRPGWDTWIVGIVGLTSGLGGLLGVSISAIGLGLLLFGLAFVATAVWGRQRPTGRATP
jgi:hypothetical protein